MKAAVINSFGPPDVFTIQDIPKPVVKDDEVLIEVKAGGINPVDYKQRKGNHKFIFGSNFPIVLGYDVSGIVVETGSAITRLKKGDKVCGVLNNKYGGGLGEYVKGAEKCFAKLPAEVDIYTAATLPLTGLTALQGLRDKGKIAKDNKILITGASGGVGHIALQIASIYDAEITVTSSFRHKDFISKLAEAKFIDYTKTDILSLNTKFNIIFDVVGKYTFLQVRHLLLPGGIYINTLPRPKILVHKFISLFTKGKKVRTFLMRQNSNDLEMLLTWMKEGKLKINIDKEFPLEEIGKAHAYMEEGHTEGKILIRYK